MIDNTKELLHLAKNLRHSFTEDQLGTLKTPHPPIDEQKRIAAFLDKKCNEIDSLICDIEGQIEVLEQYKKSVITEAVTKGLDPNAEMKDTGDEVIGWIPATWECKPIKYFTKMISKGATPSDMQVEKNEKYCIRFIKAENIQNGILNEEPSFYIDERANDVLKRSELKKDDILFVIAGATIGKVAVVKEEFCPCNTNQAVCFIRLEDLDRVPYYKYVLQSEIIAHVIKLLSVQSAQPNLSMGNIANIKVPYIKDKAVEREIADYLDRKCSNIDETIKIKQEQIDCINSYKKSLIYEYVTGKKEVPV